MSNYVDQETDVRELAEAAREHHRRMMRRQPTPFQWPDEYDLDIYVEDEGGDPTFELWTGVAEEGYQHVLELLTLYDADDIRIHCYRVADGQTDTRIWFNLTLEQLAEKAKEER